MEPATQICNCNGVSKGALIACVNAGKRSAKAVMEATLSGGKMEEDPSVHYYVSGVPLTKPDLIRAIQQHRLRSVLSVFDVLAAGVEDAVSKPGLASLLKTMWKGEYEDEKDACFMNERVHANIQRDGTFSVLPDPGRHHKLRAAAPHRGRGG